MEKDKEKEGGLLYNKLRKLITVIVSEFLISSHSNLHTGRSLRRRTSKNDQPTAYRCLRAAVVWQILRPGVYCGNWLLAPRVWRRHKKTFRIETRSRAGSQSEILGPIWRSSW